MATHEEYQSTFMSVMNSDTSVTGFATEPLRHVLTPSQFLMLSSLGHIVRKMDRERDMMGYCVVDGIIPMTMFVTDDFWFAVNNRVLSMYTGIPMSSVSKKIQELKALNFLHIDSVYNGNCEVRVLKINVMLIDKLFKIWRNAVGCPSPLVTYMEGEWHGTLEKWDNGIKLMQEAMRQG